LQPLDRDTRQYNLTEERHLSRCACGWETLERDEQALDEAITEHWVDVAVGKLAHEMERHSPLKSEPGLGRMISCTCG
jgi:hypothetical protein